MVMLVIEGSSRVAVGSAKTSVAVDDGWADGNGAPLDIGSSAVQPGSKNMLANIHVR